MSVKRFRIETPEQLRLLDAFLTGKQASCTAYATVWSATRNGHGGKSAWDNDFSVRFVAERFGQRKAYLDKADTKTGTTVALRELRYNPALSFCRENLQMIPEE